MPRQLSVILDDAESTELDAIALRSRQTPEQLAKQVMSEGLRALGRKSFYEQAWPTGDAARAQEILRNYAGNEPPQPGDELPEGYRRSA